MHQQYYYSLFFARTLGIITAGTIVFAAAVVDTQIAKTTFSCNGRSSGYYADVDSGCQVYHMCDGLGRQFSYTCPNATLFQQRMLICDHWYMVNCSKSEDDYAANLRIGQREMPFVDDSESNPYHRTPRPDLLSHPSQSEYDIIYRTGKAYKGNNLNLVGVESDSKNGSISTTDEPTYSLPSHWSTEYSQQRTTSKPSNFDRKNFETISTDGRTNNNETTEAPPVNFKSAYKNTTPVFSKTVDIVAESYDDLKLLPPLPYQLSNKTNSTAADTIASLIQTNLKSDFKGTTPVYPTSVDITSEEPSDVGILPPLVSSGEDKVAHNNFVPALDTDIRPPFNESSTPQINQGGETTKPSKYYQAPKVGDEDHNRNGDFKMLDSDEWANLRKKYLIPDYEFPLESVSRPSYDSLLNSFQVSSGPPENVINVTKETV